MKASVIAFAQLPEEEIHFLDYLAKTGDIWARVTMDNPASPAPVAKFMEVNAGKLTNNSTVDVYLGFQTDILQPIVSEVKGKTDIDMFASYLIGYTRGEYYPDGELAQSHLYYYRGSFYNDEFVEKSDAFLRWGAKVFGWIRKQAPEQVPVHRCNYNTRATAQVAKAAASGLKIWY